MQLLGRRPVEHDECALPGSQGLLAADVVAGRGQWKVAHQGQLLVTAAKEGFRISQLQIVVPARVVEARLAFQQESELPAHHPDQPSDAMARRRGVALDQWHEIDDLTDAIRRHEASHEVGRVGQVDLPGLVTGSDWSDSATASLVSVEKRGENARRIEARGAEPVDRSVPGDQGGRLKVADESVVGNLWVLCAHHVAQPPTRLPYRRVSKGLCSKHSVDRQARPLAAGVMCSRP